jgi:hypothetical protein
MPWNESCSNAASVCCREEQLRFEAQHSILLEILTNQSMKENRSRGKRQFRCSTPACPAVNDDKILTLINHTSNCHNNLVQPTLINRRPNLLPIPLLDTHSTCQPRTHQALPLSLPPKSLDLPQPLLTHRNSGLRLPQALPKAIPRHRRVHLDLSFEFPRCGTHDFRVAVGFEYEVFDVADREGDFGDWLAWGRGCQDGGVGWWFDVESLVAAAAGVGWWCGEEKVRVGG